MASWSQASLLFFLALSQTAGQQYSVTDLSLGHSACALLGGGYLKCWGNSASYELGYGDTVVRGDAANEMGDFLPHVDVGTGRTVQAVAYTWAYTMFVILDDGSLKGWGSNPNGMVGIGVTDVSVGTSPGAMGDALPVIDLGVGRTAKRVSSAANHACAILDDDTLKCWGRGLDGGLGYGDTTNRGDSAGSMGASLPAVDLGTGKLAQEVMCCKPSNTCVILTDGTVKCFGSNVYGQLGYGDTTTRGDSPTSMGDNLPAVDLGTGRTALQIGCGYEVHCALLDNGAVKCWGYGLYGLLGQETETNAGNLANTMGDFLPPINLGTGRTATSIGVAGYMVCAILDNSDLKCWGEGTSGQLGYGDASRRGSYANTMGDFLPAVDMGTGRTATKVRCGNLYWGCAVLDDDSVKCWGTGGAQQGQGDTSLRGSSSNTMGDFLPPIDLGTAPVTVTTTTLTATTSTKTSVTTTGTTSSGTITSTSTWTSTSSSTSISATSTVTSSTTETFSSTSSSTSITSTDTTTSSSTTVSSTTSSSATASSTTTSSATASSTTTSSATVSSTTTSSATTSSTTTTSTSASSSTTGSATFSSTTTSSTSLSITTSSSVTITSSSSSSSSSSISGTTSTTVSQTTTSRSTSSSITSSSSTSSSSSSSSSSSVSGTSSATFTSTSTSLSSTRSSSSSATISSTGTTTPEGNTTTTSVTPLNQEEFDKLEQLREEQAQAAVASLDASEEEAVNQTLQLLSALIADSQNSTDGVLAEASITTDAGTLKVVALSAETMSNGSNVSIGTEEGTSILVPQAVLAQAASVAGSGIVLLSVTTLSENITDKIRSDDARLGRRLDTQGSTLAGQSISLNFRGADGARLAINNLASPMELTLAVNEENATCAYFDEETLTWSTEGVETVGTSSGQVICRTSHLSIFGGILEFILADVAKVLKCSSAGDLLSAQGVSKLAELQWLAYGTSVVVFVSLFIFSLAFCFAVRLDTKVSKAIPWEHKEPVLLRTKASVAEILETEDDKASKSCCDRMKENLESSVEWFLWGIGLCFGYENLAEVVKEFLPNAPESTVNRCITTIHAHKTGTSRDSIDGVKKMSKSFSRTKSLSTSNVLEPADDPVPEDMGDRRSTSFSKRALPSSIVGKMDAFHSKHSVGLLDYQEIQEHGAKAVKSFVSSTWMTRILLLFPALHPWLETVRFSLFTSHTTRTALIITKLTSAAAVGALFFSSTSFTSSSDPDCAPPTNLLSQMIQAATVGLLSAFFGDTVIFVLFIIQSRQAVDKNEWKPREKERLLWRWRCKSTLFWLIWSCHAGFCVFYTLAFLANVSAKDAAKWLESCAISLLQDLVLVPLSVALVLATLASLAICCSRHVKHRIENDWFMDEDSEEEDDGSDQIKDCWLAPQDAEEVDEEPNDPMISVHFEEESLHSVQLGADGAVALRVAAHETPSAAPGNAPVEVPDDCTSIHSVVC